MEQTMTMTVKDLPDDAKFSLELVIKAMPTVSREVLEQAFLDSYYAKA